MIANRPNAQRQPTRRFNQMRVRAVDADELFTEDERADIAALIAALERRLLQARLTPKQDQVLRDYLAGQPQLDEGAILNALRLVMSTPEYQLT
jgi:hypothetical protein